MKIITFTMLMLLTLTASINAKPKEKTNQDHIKTYFEDIGSRDAVLRSLRYEDRDELSKLVAVYFKKDKSFDDALKLAIRLCIPNFFKVLEKKIETEYRAKIVEWCFVVQDENAIEKLYKLMIKTKDKETRADIKAGFTSYPTTLKLITAMKKLAGKKKTSQDLRVDLLDIVKYQIDKDFVDLDGLDDVWKDAEKNWKIFGKQFKIDGLDLMKYGEPNLYEVKRYGHNYKLEVGSRISFELIGKKYHKKSFKIKFWIYTFKESSISLGMAFGNGTWTASTFDKKYWRLGGKNPNQAPRLDGEWKEVIMEITDNSGDNKIPDQLMHLQIGGHDLMPNGGTSKGGLRETQVSCTEGTAYVGGFQIID